ncbi:MAG: peptidase, partial [Mycobacterium sp.]
AYDRAWWFAGFVAERYGPAALRALYWAACGVGHVDLPAAVRDVLGTDMPDLLARWRQWLAR